MRRSLRKEVICREISKKISENEILNERTMVVTEQVKTGLVRKSFLIATVIGIGVMLYKDYLKSSDDLQKEYESIKKDLENEDNGEEK